MKKKPIQKVTLKIDKGPLSIFKDFFLIISSYENKWVNTSLFTLVFFCFNVFHIFQSTSTDNQRKIEFKVYHFYCKDFRQFRIVEFRLI